MRINDALKDVLTELGIESGDLDAQSLSFEDLALRLQKADVARIALAKKRADQVFDELHLRVVHIEQGFTSNSNLGSLYQAMELVRILEAETGEITGWITKHVEDLVPQMRSTLGSLVQAADLWNETKKALTLS